MTPTPELRALTGMRGVAAWFVVLYHIRFSIPHLPDSVLAVFAKGYLAVDFFFLLSGFVIWLSWGERLRRGGAAEIPAFLRKRIARIWPLHLFMLACAAALALLLVLTGRPDDVDYPFDRLPLHVLLLQNWGFTDQLAWNDPSWSISAELGAYLLFPLLTLAIDWRRVPSAAVAAAILALCILLHAVMARGGAMLLGTDIARFGLLRCVLEFTAGNAVCALWLRWKGRRGAATGTALAAALLAGLWYAGLPETLAVPLFFAAGLLVVALTSGMPGNPLEGGRLQYLGEISYATYLGHFLLWIVFKLALIGDPRAVSPLLIGLFLLLVLVSSSLLYHLVERPAQHLIDGWRRKPRGRFVIHLGTNRPS